MILSTSTNYFYITKQLQSFWHVHLSNWFFIYHIVTVSLCHRCAIISTSNSSFVAAFSFQILHHNNKLQSIKMIFFPSLANKPWYLVTKLVKFSIMGKLVGVRPLLSLLKSVNLHRKIVSWLNTRANAASTKCKTFNIIFPGKFQVVCALRTPEIIAHGCALITPSLKSKLFIHLRIPPCSKLCNYTL